MKYILDLDEGELSNVLDIMLLGIGHFETGTTAKAYLMQLYINIKEQIGAQQ